MSIFLNSILDYLILFSVFSVLVLLPGYFFIRVIFSQSFLNKTASFLPTNFRPYFKRYFYFLFAPGTGLFLVDFLMLILGRLGVEFGFKSLFIGSAAVTAALFLINYFLVNPLSKKEKKSAPKNLDRGLFLALAAIWIFSVGIRTIFYLPDVLPQDTDLGHHMYFSQNIVNEGKIPSYDTSEVIVGEHLIFAFISILSGISLLSAMPLIVLFFFNLMATLSIAFFTFLLTGKKKIALLAFAFFGAYYAIDPPQGRYVNGGVVGNTFGNYLLCLILILAFIFGTVWLRKISEKFSKDGFSVLPSILATIFFLLLGILYTHHLSSFLLLFNLLFFFIFWLSSTVFILRKERKRIFTEIGSALRSLFVSPTFMLTILFVIAVPLLVYIPFYLSNNAVETVARAPLKESHTGIEWLSLTGKFGWLKIIFSFAGIVLIVRSFSWIKAAFVFSWFLPLFLLSFFPQIFNISIPSRRVATYMIFPLTVLAAYGLFGFLGWLKKRMKEKYWMMALFILIGIFVFDGTQDFRSSYSSVNKFQETVELYQASKYLAEKTSTDAVMLKDHSAIAGDSWIKFFLQRGYDYFISRTYDYKYETVDPYNTVDVCPREMVSVPDSNQSKTCYGQTQTNYVILKPKGDDFLFWKSNRFDLIYSSDSIAVFKTNDSK